MGAETKISWTDHTFNPLQGCTKVSEACRFCYAESINKRWGGDNWGPDKPRKLFGDKHWAEPVKWNAHAQKTGIRRKVFCASMADVCEDHPDWIEPRARLIKLIEATPWLDYLLLTKRPENYLPMFGESWGYAWPENVWAGTTAEDQQNADKRIPHLLKVPAVVRFVSCEPLLGPINLKPYLAALDGTQLLDQIIIGGESGGHGIRRMDPAWSVNIRNQCVATNTAFFFKQSGAVLAREMKLKSRNGDDPSEFHADFAVQQFPTPRMF